MILGACCLPLMLIYKFSDIEAFNTGSLEPLADAELEIARNINGNLFTRIPGMQAHGNGYAPAVHEKSHFNNRIGMMVFLNIIPR